MAQFPTDLNARINIKREANLQAYIAPRLEELRALDPVLKELGLEPVVREVDKRVVVSFENPSRDRASVITLHFDGKAKTRSATASWAKCIMDVDWAEILTVSDNGWTSNAFNYPEVHELREWPPESVIPSLIQFLPENPVVQKGDGPTHTQNFALAVLYEDLKEVLNKIGGGPVLAERRQDDVHGTVEMLVFTDAEGRKYHLEFFNDEEAVLRENGAVHYGGSREDRAELKASIRAIQAGSVPVLK
ncbi:hypothetical protein P6U16_00570 [Rhizobium sp. 32-5/1]|uniref:hypothetical protein n=1 Tax=Rhizobium sp. 32-5/1 TaxID=3019602 RepID=UPI00240E77F3|nr:hypothetical protein [Rhizobium sp. 32-5/1]WEZ83424.1 hypothetical protein P6U16_00570 [Rhizobium sp. 32-5/1]